MKRLWMIAVFVMFAGCDRTDHEAAIKSAREFMQDIPDATNVKCADQDSDGDGYVTCTIFRGKTDPLSIQCGSEKYCVNCIRGCKYIPFKNR